MKSITDMYTNGEATLEETNAALKENGAGFHLDPTKNPEGGWTEQEMKEGFFPPPAGTPKVVRPRRPDMRRRMDLAGQTVVQYTKLGKYAVSYDADGYALVAKKI